MSNLIVVSCPTPEGAQDLSDVLWQADEEGIVHIEDLAVVRRDLDGPAQMWQSVQPDDDRRSFLTGAFWGAALGTLFMIPLTGVATGAVVGLAASRGSDFGIDDDFIRQVRDRLEPGTSALFVLGEAHDIDALRERLGSVEFEIQSTSLDPEREAELRALFESD